VQHKRACVVVANANAGQPNTVRTAPTSAKQLLQRESVKQPWYIGFQTNERTLEWEESAQIQLLKIYVAEKSGQVLKDPVLLLQCRTLLPCTCHPSNSCLLQDIEWVHERLSELVVLLPDIVAKLNNVKADLLLQLLDTKVRAQVWKPS
jgi:hypothetical protein